MKHERKSTRDWLTLSTKKPFNEVIDEAKLSPTQFKIAHLRFIERKYNYQIAAELGISESTVDKEIAKAYEAINRVLVNL